MKNHNELTDSEFIQQFESCQFPPALFSHEAHLRLVWIHIKTYGIEQATENIQRQLIHFTRFVGATDKYNVTITRAAIYIVYHFMQQTQTGNFKEFILEFPQLQTDFKKLIARHYSSDIFNSEEARKAYLVPDLLPFN